jgi:hypothetical protein
LRNKYYTIFLEICKCKLFAFIDNPYYSLIESKREKYMHHSKWFAAFLLVYGGMLLVHVWTGVHTWHAWAILCGGAAVAAAAHQTHGKTVLFFLTAHICLEVWYHAGHIAHYGAWNLFLHGAHFTLDVIFLWLERGHMGKWGTTFFFATLGVLGVVFWYKYVPIPPPVRSFVAYMPVAHVHDHTKNLWQTLALGGVLGCVLFHLRKSLSKKTPEP